MQCCLLCFHLFHCSSVKYLVDRDYNWPMMQYILEVAAVFICLLLLMSVKNFDEPSLSCNTKLLL
jgi:hypothetical protein